MITGDARKTEPDLSKYELAMLLGVRAEQIARGAGLYFEAELRSGSRPYDPLEMAAAEWRAGKLPLKLRRKVGPGLW